MLFCGSNFEAVFLAVFISLFQQKSGKLYIKTTVENFKTIYKYE